MGGPEEWPSCRSNLADRIRLIGPAATSSYFQSLTDHRTTGSRCDAGVTQLNGIGRKLGLRLLENSFAHENGKRANHTPLQAKLPERCTETLDPSLSGKNDAIFV